MQEASPFVITASIGVLCVPKVEAVNPYTMVDEMRIVNMEVGGVNQRPRHVSDKIDRHARLGLGM
jgi:hypothetical protein